MSRPETVAIIAATVAIAAQALPALAQPNTPGGFTPGWPWDRPSVSKSDEHRIVGRVLEIDRSRGFVTLQTADEGMRLVQPAPTVLAAIRVGDTISVPRAAAEGASALPRQQDRR